MDLLKSKFYHIMITKPDESYKDDGDDEEILSSKQKRRLPQFLPSKNKIRENCSHLLEHPSSSQECRSRCRFPGCKQFMLVASCCNFHT